MTKTRAPRTDLPKIVRFEGVSDSGEFGNATCPHCGADGRYVYTFTVEDGRTLGAMAGCIKLFPVSELAEEHKKVLDKTRSHKRLNGWDEKIMAAVDDAATGAISIEEALNRVHAQQASRQAWMRKKGYQR